MDFYAGDQFKNPSYMMKLNYNPNSPFTIRCEREPNRDKPIGLNLFNVAKAKDEKFECGYFSIAIGDSPVEDNGRVMKRKLKLEVVNDACWTVLLNYMIRNFSFECISIHIGVFDCLTKDAENATKLMNFFNDKIVIFGSNKGIDSNNTHVRNVINVAKQVFVDGKKCAQLK
jgi:hypothetical protein